MLMLCPELTVYNHSRTHFVMFMREPPAPSPYLHLFIVMLVHFLHIFLLIGFHPDADIVCSRAKHHYDPQGPDPAASEAATNKAEGVATLERFRQAFKPTHDRMKQLMYFC